MTLKNDETMIKELYEALLSLSTVDETKRFLDDLCTIKEIEAMSQRLRSAKMLLQGKTYIEIVDETEISSATLARVSKCVRYGQGGYKDVIDKQKK